MRGVFIKFMKTDIIENYIFAFWQIVYSGTWFHIIMAAYVSVIERAAAAGDTYACKYPFCAAA